MCHTDAINIVTVNQRTTSSKGISTSYLVANDPPTYLVILHTTSGVSDPITATSKGGPSPTHPEWGSDLPPHRGTLLGGV